MAMPAPQGPAPQGAPNADPKDMLLGIGTLLKKLVEIFQNAKGLPPEEVQELSRISDEYLAFVDKFMGSAGGPAKGSAGPEPVPAGKPGIVPKPY